MTPVETLDSRRLLLHPQSSWPSTAGTGTTSSTLHEAPGRGAGARGPLRAPAAVVTIQLPIYNEMYVAERLIDAVCRIDYPRDRLEIQVLDDSTDETHGVAELAVRRQRRARRRHHVPPPGGPAPATRPARSRRACRRRAASSSPSSTPTSCRPPISSSARSTTSPTRRSAWSRRAGATSTRTTRCSPRSRRSCSTAHFVIEHGGRNRAGLLLQLQRHGGHLAPRGDRRRRRLAARHADRGPRPELPRAAPGLAVRLPARPGRAGRGPGRDERLQVAAAPLGEGLDPDRRKLLPRILALGPAVRRQDRGVLPPDGELQLPADGACCRS